MYDVSQIFTRFEADENDPASYDFPMTDESILCALDADTKTFYRLGESIDHGIVKHRSVPPKDFHKFARICEHIVRHYNEGWADGFHLDIEYWEIWNEPNFVPQCWTGTTTQFYDLYEATAKHLKSCFPNLKIGGPAVAGGDPEWTTAFLTEMKKRNVPIDFFSWHLYEKTPEALMDRAREVNECLRLCGYENAEHILNEWNYVRGWVEDFQYSINTIHALKGAAFAMATISEAQALDGLDMLMYYDTRPSPWCGAFDYYSYEKLKGYYPLAWYGQNYYDLESYIPALDSVKDIYTLCGTDKEGKITCIVTHYSDDDNVASKTVKLDFGRKAKFEVYLVDEKHNGERVKVTSNTKFKLPLHSFLLLKEI
jgi:hypothetical protein